MAQIIITKNGTGSAYPAALAQGEIALNVSSGSLFFGTSGSSNAVSSSFVMHNLHLIGSGSDGGEEKGNLTASGDISSSGTITANSFVGTLGSAAQTNITSVGTLGSLTVSGDITANGNIVGDDGTDITNINQIGCDEIFHDGDGDTKITFTDDDINITVGNVNMVDFTEDTVSEVTFNEGAANLDFRIESSNDTKAFYVDANINAVQLGSATGTHVTASGNISSSGALSTFGEVVHLEGTDPRLKLKAKGANHPGIEWHEDSTRKWVVYNDPDESDNLTFKNNSTELVKISQTGGLNIATSGGHVTASGNISASGYFEGDRKFKVSTTTAGNTSGADVVYFGIS